MLRPTTQTAWTRSRLGPSERGLVTPGTPQHSSTIALASQACHRPQPRTSSSKWQTHHSIVLSWKNLRREELVAIGEQPRCQEPPEWTSDAFRWAGRL